MANLIPEDLLKTIPPLYSTEDQNDPLVYVKLFLDNWHWYITEISHLDNDICFGYVVSPFCDGELGYFSLDEIKLLGIVVRNDFLFKVTPLSQIKKLYK